MASLTLGLRSLVNDIIASGRYSTYYIGGFGNLNDDVIRLCLRVAASGHVSDTILCMVLEDDRLPKLMDDILEEIDAEVNYVTSLSDGVLSILGSVAGLAVRPLRDELIHAAAVQAWYLKMRLCYFITCEEPESNTQTRTTIIGVKALKKHFAINRHKMDTKAEMNLQDIKALNMYKFLLSDAEEKVVTAMTSYVATSSTGAQVSVGGDEPTKKPGPKKNAESANKFAQGFFD